MPPKNPQKLFLHYKAALIHELGRKGLSDTEINAIGKREFGSSWAGCHAQDRATFKPNTYQVINTDMHDKPGTHWLALRLTRKRAYVFDSFGRSIPQLVSHLASAIKKNGFQLTATDLGHHHEQVGYTSEVCGHDSLSILLVVRDLGIRKAQVL